MLAVVLFTYARIGLLLINYNAMWVQPEEFNWREYILTQEVSSATGYVSMALNWRVFEYEPRITRPLSHVFEIINTKFRAWLWKALPPHPSLSLTWFFILGLSPLMFFGLLRNLGIERSLAGMITALYLANPGTLSLAAVDFRPSKPLANFAIVCALYWASLLNKRSANDAGRADRNFLSFSLLCVFLFLSFLVDETALLCFPAILVFFPGQVFSSIKRTICFFALPPVTYLAYFHWIPKITALAGFELPRLGNYAPAAALVGWSNIPKLFGAAVLGDLHVNLRLFLSDTFGLVDPRLSRSWFYTVLWFAVTACLCMVGTKIIVSLYRNGRRGISWLSLQSLAALIGATFFANVTLHLVENRVWGLHWLNSYWPIFFWIVLAVVLNTVELNRVFAGVATALVVMASVYNFIYVNNAFKQFFYYRTVVFEDVLVHKVNRFDIPTRSDSELFRKTLAIWRDQRYEAAFKGIPTELYYVVHDLRLNEAGRSEAQQWSVFDGHVLEFDMVRDESGKFFRVVPSKRSADSSSQRDSLCCALNP